MMWTWWTIIEGVDVADERIPDGSWIDQHPPHPGETILHDGLGGTLSVSEAARRLAVPRSALDRVLKGAAPVTARLALRLEEQGWSNAEFWLRLQAAYDLATERMRRTEAARLPAPT